ncbi:hypothetical protein FRC08_015668, partial [Ceratobasidium sp. 394]
LWSFPHKYRRTPYATNGRTCSVGSIALSSDESFVAISTLEQSIVTYALSADGPILESKAEVGLNEDTKFRPIVPIAVTSNNLVMKGTASEGVIPIFDLRSSVTASLEHGTHRTIRTLTTRGDRVIVGSTDVSGDINGSCIVKCYSSLMSEQQDRLYSGTSKPPFRVVWADVKPLSDPGYDSIWYKNTIGFLMRMGGPKVIMIVFLLVLAGMAVETPGQPLQAKKQAVQPDYAGYTKELSVLRVRFEPNVPRNPTLWQILRYIIGFALAQMAIWGTYGLVLLNFYFV